MSACHSGSVLLAREQGALGFLPIFNRYDDVIGNFGIRDQEMALRWVQKNIAAFDGDPSKVTLFGAGAGCQSVALHLTSVTAQNLFRSAILQSCPFTLPFRNKNEARRVVKRFASALGCQDNDLDCYRQKSATEILRAQDDAADTASTEPPSLFQFQAWGPIIDQRGVHDSHLLQELLQANSRPVSGTPKPIMMGFAEEEGRTSVYRDFPLPVSSDFFQQFVQTVFPDKWRQVAETAEAPYRPSTNQDARLEMVRFLNDFVYVCPGHRVAQQLSGSAGASGNNRDVWVYSFKPSVTWSPGGSAWPLGGESYCQDVACHDLDLLYLFNPPSIPDFRRPRTEGLSTAMATYWTNFAKYGDPNGASSRAVLSHPAGAGGRFF
nr:hypothetical protein BaRGS_012762 [Batillaria attramentaria]